MVFGSDQRIFTFVGPVGVGKSTQMFLLKSFLKSRRINVVTSYIKSTQGLAFLLSKFLILVGGSEEIIFPDGKTQIYPKKHLMSSLFGLWTLLDTFSIFLKFFFTVYLPFRLGFVVLIEEGFMMTIFTYEKSFPVLFKIESRTPRLIHLLVKWMSNRNITLIFDASDDDLKERRRSRAFRQSELSVFINMQRDWMKHFTYDKTILIDTTNRNAKQVHNELITALFNSN
ncbi:MAG: hypothetical protein P8X47_10505 [Ignavibacteriaceae bacterium]